MNNLFKYVFLLVNIISSTTSTNNSSLPLSGTDLTTWQNTSELAKREEPIFLDGGLGVTGLSIANGIPFQRDCTLSFPVKRTDNATGILTSRACVTNDIFVGDTKVSDTGSPFNFDQERGLDYTLIWFKWGDLSYSPSPLNEKLPYSSCVSNDGGIRDILIPIIPIATQPPYPNFTVCAYGGASGFTCGEIVEFNVGIRTPVPWLGFEADVYFKNVTKVKMNKNYLPGDLGAPVYIPLQLPNSTQFVASPVGQVVEALYEKEENVWYYIPLERILEDGKLEIHSLIEDKKSPSNQNVSVSDNLGIEPNTSELAVPNQPNQMQILFTHAGLKVWASSNSHYFISTTVKQCTLGFAIRKNVGGRGVIRYGFLTLGSCLSTDRVNARNGAFNVRGQEVQEIILFGVISNLKYTRLLGLNFALVSIFPNDATHLFWDDEISTSMPVPGGFADVASTSTIPFVGFQVCFEGGYSGHLCGTVIDTAATLTSVNPWEWAAYMRQRILGLSPIESWQNLIKVRLIEVPRAFSEGVKSSDFGAPVYYVLRSEGNRITKVQPVGIVMDYVYEEELLQGQWVCRIYMYCVSVDRILLNHPELRLIGTP